MKNELSRRSFLKGAALSALAVSTMGVSTGVAEAPAEEFKGTGKWYDEKYFAKPAPITDIAEVIDTEVVVVGAGNGGCVAAVSAADLGAKVVWVEKNGGPITWAGEIGAYNSKVMKEKYGIKNVHIGCVGGVVGSHVGPGALVLGYLGEKR